VLPFQLLIIQYHLLNTKPGDEDCLMQRHHHQQYRSSNPAAVKYCSAGHPKPPAPITNTLLPATFAVLSHQIRVR
jgi:hypothetical protein